MQYTENLDLLKPDQNEQYDIDHFNQNADTLDAHIHALEVTSSGMQAYIDAGDAASRQFSNMEGICQLSQGGTGKTTAQDALDELHKDVPTESVALSDVDEFLFMRRTPEDIERGTPESITVKNVLLDELAQKIFDLISGNQQGSISYGIFSPTANGFTPKSGSAGATKFLNALGAWEEPQGRVDVINVTTSGSYDVGLNTVFRLQSNATVLIRDPSIFMASLVFVNETAQAQLLSLRMKDGNVSYRINKGKVWRLSWTGNFWVPTYEEPEVGALRPTLAVTAPEGWFLCDGTDTTGTANELSTCFPNLYEFLGSSNVLPDFRECALVGAGRNTLDTIAEHDVFDVGQFKDDQSQNHKHNRGDMNITGTTKAATDRGDATGAFYDNAHSDNAYGGGPYSSYGQSFDASRNWTGETSNPLHARAGSVTRGKRKGVNYIIKA